MPRGGKRTPGPGKTNGRPALGKTKRIKIGITLRPDHFEKLRGHQNSAVIEQALDEHFK